MEQSVIQELSNKLNTLVEQANELKAQIESSQSVSFNRQHVQDLLIRAVRAGRQTVFNQLPHERFSTEVSVEVGGESNWFDLDITEWVRDKMRTDVGEGIDDEHALDVLESSNIWSVEE
jgi:hypothetical protein